METNVFFEVIQGLRPGPFLHSLPATSKFWLQDLAFTSPNSLVSFWPPQNFAAAVGKHRNCCQQQVGN